MEAEALERRLQEAAKLDMERFNQMLLKAAGLPPTAPARTDLEDWGAFKEWMEQREFADELDPEDYEDVYVEMYHVWQSTDDYMALLEHRRNTMQHRLDNGEWDSDDDYEMLYSTVERLNSIWQEVRTRTVHVDTVDHQADAYLASASSASIHGKQSDRDEFRSQCTPATKEKPERTRVRDSSPAPARSGR